MIILSVFPPPAVRTFCVLAAVALASSVSICAAEITGAVSEVSGKTATIRVSGGNPAIGDSVELFFKISGIDDEISVATGKVTALESGVVKVAIESATGEVAKGHSARITSTAPTTSTQPAASPPPRKPERTAPPVATTPSTAAYRSAVQRIATHVFTFDELPVGPLALDAFASAGLRFQKGKGEPGIYAVATNMLLPSPHAKILLIGGERVTAFTIRLDPPVKRFALYRAGAANGASTPTWKMIAYNRSNKVVGRAGEEHRIAPAAAPFAIEATEIVRVEVTTDNRHGSGTWATWNSLPVIGFGFER